MEITVETQRINDFIGIESEVGGDTSFKDVTELCESISDFEENAEPGQCFLLSETDGYIYKIADENGDCYSVVLAGAGLQSF